MRALDASILLLSLAASPLICAQQIDSAKRCSQTMVSVHDLFKQGGGWDIAFIDSSTVLSKESALKTPDPIYSGVTSVQLGLKNKEFDFPTIQLNNCSRDAIIEESRMLVLHVFAFKKGDRVFAYRLSGEIQNLLNGEWQSCMCAGEMVVYDPDGTGTFNHLILYWSGLPYLPDWVRGHASTTGK